MSEGLARLAELKKAHQLKQSAKFLRAHVSMYSPEYDFVGKAHKLAGEYDNKARILEEK